MSKKMRFEPADDASSSEAEDIDEIEEEEGESDGHDISDDEKLPVLSSIIKKGKVTVNKGHNLDHHQSTSKDKEAEKLAIRQELSSLSFEELQKLKEKIGSKKFNETVIGAKRKEVDKVKDFRRLNANRPREMSSKNRRVQEKVAIQVSKVFRNDPRFDNLCGEFNEQKFHKHYDFVNKIKEEEIEKLKKELKEETVPRKVEKIKYLIQRMQNQLREEKRRKEAEEKKKEEKQLTIDALNQGRMPYFAPKSTKHQGNMKEKYEKLKKDSKLDQYMAKKRKHNAQRDRKSMPAKEEF